MDDRELLELAAKAAGFGIENFLGGREIVRRDPDGQAERRLTAWTRPTKSRRAASFGTRLMQTLAASLLRRPPA